MKVKIPLKLKDFQVISNNTTKDEVKSDLKDILSFMYEKEKIMFESNIILSFNCSW